MHHKIFFKPLHEDQHSRLVFKKESGRYRCWYFIFSTDKFEWWNSTLWKM